MNVHWSWYKVDGLWSPLVISSYQIFESKIYSKQNGKIFCRSVFVQTYFFFNTIVTNGSDEHIFNAFCTNLHPVFL